MTAESLGRWPLVRGALIDTFRWFWPVLRQAWIFLLVLHFVDAIASDYFSYASEFISDTGREETGLLALLISVDVLFALIWSSLWMVVLAKTAEATAENHALPPWSESIGRSLNQLMIETVRSFSAVLFRVPLLIVPAIYEYIRLTYVPLVVIFDPSYSRGEVDALRKSRELFARHRFILFALLLLSFAVPRFIESSLEGESPMWFWQAPGRFALATLLTLVVNLASGLFLIALFRRLESRANA